MKNSTITDKTEVLWIVSIPVAMKVRRKKKFCSLEYKCRTYKSSRITRRDLHASIDNPPSRKGSEA